MAVCYKKLWKLLIDKDMKKIDLEREAGITHYALGQSIDDIIEFIQDSEASHD